MQEPSLADDLHSVRITTDGVRAGVTLAGHEVSASLSGYTLEHRANQPPLLVLYVRPPVDAAVFDGYAQVAVASEVPPTDAIVAFLAGIDPSRLQQAALNRDDLDGSPTELTTAMLRQLTEWAGGRP
ncbi:hypothetical protein HUT19_41835 (plasmid) [Streptomyces sp. NA02950]|uniref:hypothetical protein n=1 Tax=Streptomyces sp. NA02950 TaxID=2742137 RepID=UPI001590FD42|nr:hypothetical protein [Streptomyces sp. NA02950]QKV98261.1 hypothetical protein HUT19_41835 [Streptomyces sp. NA02950]